MPGKTRQLSLTRDHVARVHRSVQDSGIPAGFQPQTDADYEGWVEHMIGTNPAPASPPRIFAYGSLIWKPEIEHAGEQLGVARGWHRAFCFQMPRFRGTPEEPGLMMALDRGGQCIGVLYDLPPNDVAGQFGRLLWPNGSSRIQADNLYATLRAFYGDTPSSALRAPSPAGGRRRSSGDF